MLQQVLRASDTNDQRNVVLQWLMVFYRRFQLRGGGRSRDTSPVIQQGVSSQANPPEEPTSSHLQGPAKA
jgi:hypothetical protein